MLDLSPYKSSSSLRRKSVRVDSSKIAVTDINKLKSLPATPYIQEEKANDYYIEPVVIEYYIPKESRFAYETKFLYVELYDPEPLNEAQAEVMGYFKERNEPIDIIEAMNAFPQYIRPILQSYNMYMELHEKTSMEYKSGLEGDNPVAIRRALYINEVLRKKEPKLAALEILGDYTTYNINWCIRFLMKNGIEHTLEDKTLEYLIKLHYLKQEEAGYAPDERFDILAAIYMEQAFPYDEDYFEEDDF